MTIPKNKISRFKDNLFNSCEHFKEDIGCSSNVCKCALQASRIDKYAKANIPTSYWLLSAKDFKGDKKFKDFITKKVKNIDNFYDLGKSILFVGGLGTGKTYMACVILKLAITSDYEGSYTTMADVVNSILSNQVDSHSYINKLLSYDFLVIDEFDSRWIFPSDKAEQIFGSSLEYILRTRFQNKVPTVLCSNSSDVDSILSGPFAKALRSLRGEHLDVIYVGGKDFRRINDV